MKQKERGFAKGRDLGPGWSYFVPPDAFAAQLERVKREPEIVEVFTLSSSPLDLV